MKTHFIVNSQSKQNSQLSYVLGCPLFVFRGTIVWESLLLQGTWSERSRPWLHLFNKVLCLLLLSTLWSTCSQTFSGTRTAWSSKAFFVYSAKIMLLQDGWFRFLTLLNSPFWLCTDLGAKKVAMMQIFLESSHYLVFFTPPIPYCSTSMAPPKYAEEYFFALDPPTLSSRSMAPPKYVQDYFVALDPPTLRSRSMTPPK